MDAHVRVRRPSMFALVGSGALALALAACAGGPQSGQDAPSGGDPGSGGSASSPSPRPSVSVQVPISAATTRALYGMGLAAVGEAVEGSAETANAVSSPVGLSAMLTQIAQGAAGPAAEALEAALGGAGEELVDQYRQVWGLWAPWTGDPEAVAGREVPDAPVIALDARVVADDQTQLEPSWRRELAARWGTPVESRDLQAPSAKDDLDQWVREATGGLVERSGIDLDDSSRIVLQNALVFGAAWQSPFDPADTESRPFTRSDGSTVPVDMMYQGMRAAAIRDAGWTAATLPYQDSELVAHLLMPDDPDAVTPEGVLGHLEALAEAAPVQVTLGVPTVDASGRQDLDSTLDRLGLSALFSAPDLSGIGQSEGRPLALSQMASQTVLMMDEAGTVAAAVHEAQVGVTSAETGATTIVFDHPYLVVLADRATNTPLILAWIGDPSAS
jgi:serpin B